MDWILEHVADAVKWTLTALIMVLAWIYKRDRDEAKLDRSELKAQAGRISALEGHSVTRDELGRAIDRIHNDLREDLTLLREDLNERLDMLIRIGERK